MGWDWDDFIDQPGLLDGIADSLKDTAEEAYEAVDLLRMWHQSDDSIREMKEPIRQRFLDFSSADISPEGTIQTMIDTLDSIWQDFEEHSTWRLERSLELLDHWSGNGAENARDQITRLKNRYSSDQSKNNAVAELTQLQSDVVGVREMIAKGHEDLRQLTSSFHRAAEEYREAESASQVSPSDILKSGFAGAVTGLLTVAAVPTGGMSLVAGGAIIAAHAAGSMVVTGLADASITGGDPFEIHGSYIEAIDELKSEIRRVAVEEFVPDIDAAREEVSGVPRPPDVSPGDEFDPDEDFTTPEMPQDVEDDVREADVDIPEYQPGDRQRDRDRADDEVADPHLFT